MDVLRYLNPLSSILVSILLTAIFPICALAQTHSMDMKSEEKDAKWSYEFTLTQWHASEGEANYDSTEIENTLTHEINKKYSAGFYLYVGKNWLKGNHIEEGKQESFFDDPQFFITRQWKIPVKFSLYLPTSEDSQDSSRRFTFSIQPKLTFNSGPAEITLKSEFLYFNNAESVSKKDETVLNRVLGIVTKGDISWEMTNDWTFDTNGALKFYWDPEGQPTQSYELTIGPSYAIDKTTSVNFSYYTTDDLYTDYYFLSKDVSYFGIGLTLQL